MRLQQLSNQQQQLIEQLKAEIERLRARRDSLTGWWVAKDCDDGSLILQSHTGERRHVWQGGDEKLAKEIEQLKAENGRLQSRLIRAAELREPANALISMQKEAIKKLEAEIAFLKVQRGGQHMPEVFESSQRTWEGDS